MFLNNQVYNLLALLKRIKTLATNSKRLITLKIIMPMITELIKIYATCQILTKTVIIATTDEATAEATRAGTSTIVIPGTSDIDRQLYN